MDGNDTNPQAGANEPDPIADFIGGGLDELPEGGEGEATPAMQTEPAPVVEPTPTTNPGDPSDPTPTPTGLPDNNTNNSQPTTGEEGGSSSEDDDFGSPFEGNATSSNDGGDGGTNQSQADFDAEVALETQGMDAKAGAKWKTLKQQLRDANQQIADLQANPTDSQELEQLRSRMQAYEEMETNYSELQKKAALHDYTQTPEYKSQVEEPFESIQTLASNLETANGLEEGTIIRAIVNSSVEQQDAAIAEIQDSVNPRTLAAIHEMANKVTMLYGREAEIAENADTLLTEYNNKRQNELAVESEQNRIAFASDVDATFTQFKNKIPALIDDAGNNSAIYDGMVSKAKDLDFGSMDGESKAFAAMSSVILPTVVKQLKAAQNKINDLEALNAQYRGSTPQATGGGNQPQPTAGEATPESVLNNFFG